MRARFSIIGLFGLLVLGVSLAHGHGGGLDSKGCHNDRKRGGYHCHRAQIETAPSKQKSQPTKPPGPFEEKTKSKNG